MVITIEICKNMSKMLFRSDLNGHCAKKLTSVWLSFANQKQIKDVYNRLWYETYFRIF